MMTSSVTTVFFYVLFLSWNLRGCVASCGHDALGTILDGPRDVTVFENKTTTFKCTIKTEDYIDTNWDINRARHWFLTSEATRRRNFSVNENYVLGDYFFFLPARVGLNNSKVQCRYKPLDIWDYTCSENATLTIQGPPGAVSGMRVVANESHVVVSWRAPFTLDVTGVEFDLTFSLLISNVTDESPADIVCEACHNLTLPSFVFSPLHPLPGHSFNFTVTALNGAGTGPPSHTLTATLHNITEGDNLDANKSTSTEIVSPMEASLTKTSATQRTVMPVSVSIPQSSSLTLTTPSQTLIPTGTDSSAPNIAIIYGIVCSTVLIMITTAVVILCVVVALGAKQRPDQFEIHPNPVYELSTIEIQQNPVYATAHQVQHGGAMGCDVRHSPRSLIDASMSCAPVAIQHAIPGSECSATPNPGHSSESTPFSGSEFRMHQNPVYAERRPIHTTKNIAYEHYPA